MPPTHVNPPQPGQFWRTNAPRGKRCHPASRRDRSAQAPVDAVPPECRRSPRTPHSSVTKRAGSPTPVPRNAVRRRGSSILRHLNIVAPHQHVISRPDTGAKPPKAWISQGQSNLLKFAPERRPARLARGLLDKTSSFVPYPRSPSGWAEKLRYTLQGPFPKKAIEEAQSASRKKARSTKARSS